jgi:hypothetical protein
MQKNIFKNLSVIQYEKDFPLTEYRELVVLQIKFDKSV